MNTQINLPLSRFPEFEGAPHGWSTWSRFRQEKYLAVHPEIAAAVAAALNKAGEQPSTPTVRVASQPQPAKFTTEFALKTIRQMEEKLEAVEVLKMVWQLYVGEPVPADRQFMTWLNNDVYGGPEIIKAGIMHLNQWINQLNTIMQTEIEAAEAEGREPDPKTLKEGTKDIHQLCAFASRVMMNKKIKLDECRQKGGVRVEEENVRRSLANVACPTCKQTSEMEIDDGGNCVCPCGQSIHVNFNQVG